MRLFSWLLGKRGVVKFSQATNSNGFEPNQKSDPVLGGYELTIQNLDNKISQINEELKNTADIKSKDDLKKQLDMLSSLKSRNQSKALLKLIKNQEKERLRQIEKERNKRREERILKSLEQSQRKMAIRTVQTVKFQGISIKYTLKLNEKTGNIEVKIKEVSLEKTVEIPKNHIALGEFTKAVIKEENSSRSSDSSHGI